MFNLLITSPKRSSHFLDQNMKTHKWKIVQGGKKFHNIDEVFQFIINSQPKAPQLDTQRIFITRNKKFQNENAAISFIEFYFFFWI